MSSSSRSVSPATISVRRSSVFAVDLLELEQLLLDQRGDSRLVAEEHAELGDALLEVGVLVLDALALEAGERAEPQVEDRLRLELAEPEALHQPRPRLVGVVGRADELDDLVEVVERDEVALEDVRAGERLPQLELRAPRDDLALEVEVVADELEERQRPRHAVDERDGVVAERRLERRVLEELVQRDLRHRLALQLDLDAHAGLVGVVLEVGDLGDHLLAHEVGDLRDHAAVAALLHAVRELGDDDRVLPSAQLLDVRAGAHDDPAAAGSVRVADARPADDDGAGREVRALDELHEVLDARGRLVDERDDRVDRLGEVVRRDVRGHSDRDARRSVDEQVREAGRKHLRLAARLVVVRAEVDRVRVDVAEHLRRELREPALGVALGGRRVVVDRAEVPLPVDERVAERERLHEPRDRVVDRARVVRVVLAHHVAGDASALHVRPVRLVPGVVHRPEDAAVDGLEPVAHVRQRAADDDAHRVVEVARAHLLLELARLDAARAERLYDIRHPGPPGPRRSRPPAGAGDGRDATS